MRIKFICHHKSEDMTGHGSIVLTPVTPIDGEIEKGLTPVNGGNINFQFQSADALAQFAVGKEYFLDVTPAK